MATPMTNPATSPSPSPAAPTLPKVPLVAIAPPAFDVALSIAYATSNNFTGRPV